LRIGANSVRSYFYNGPIDELKFTNAEWPTRSFTPPAAPY
jgi:hypothetical protein